MNDKYVNLKLNNEELETLIFILTKEIVEGNIKKNKLEDEDEEKIKIQKKLNKYNNLFYLLNYLKR